MAEKFFADNTGRQNALKYMQALTNPSMREGLSFWDYDKTGEDALSYALSEAGGMKEDDPILRQILSGMFSGQYGSPKVDEQGWSFGNPRTQALLREAGI